MWPRGGDSHEGLVAHSRQEIFSGDPSLSCTVHLVWWQLLSAVVMSCLVGGCDGLSCAFDVRLWIYSVSSRGFSLRLFGEEN